VVTIAFFFFFLHYKQEEEKKKKKAYLGPAWVLLWLQALNFGSSPPSSKLLKLVLHALVHSPLNSFGVLAME
jgi:hypothetical protein